MYGFFTPTVMIYYVTMYDINRKSVFYLSFIPGCGFQLIQEIEEYNSPMGKECVECAKYGKWI